MNAVEMGRAVSSLTTDLLLGDRSPDEHFVVLMKPKFDTACWSYLPPHRIYIGDKCLSRGKKGLRKAQLLAYLKAFFRHEVSHLRWTERDLVLVNKELAARGIPFSLWNLFEDARCEHKEREESKEKFGWAEFEVPELPIEGKHGTPVSEFYLLIQLENESREDRTPEVVEYYDRAIGAPTSLALLPIMEDWIKQFGKDAPSSRFSDEMQFSLGLHADAKALAEFDEGTFKPGAAPSAKSPVKVKARKRSKLLSKESVDVDFERAERLASKFLGLFGSRTIVTRSNEPSARVSARHLEMERPCYKRKTTVPSVAKQLCLVVDCSGSMDDGPIEDARLLAWALSYLASLGKLKGCLVLSAVVGETAVNEVFEFPVSKDIVARIHAFGDAEGLNAAILSNHRRLSEADMVFVKTDGSICDEPLDQAEVRRRGLTVCGLHSGGVSAVPDMAKHFKRFLVRESLESLIDALLQSRLA